MVGKMECWTKLFVSGISGTSARDNVAVTNDVYDNNTSRNIKIEEIFIKSEHGDITKNDEELDMATDKGSGQ